MTEMEKAINGLLYDANYDESLKNERNDCKEECLKFNNLSFKKEAEKKDIIRKLFGKTKGDFNITSPFWCDYGYNIEIGENFYTNHNCTILDANKVIFGDNVFIGPSCTFSAAGHPIDLERRNRGLEYAYPITVGDNVWFGANVSVLPGVTIGDNVVIGAGCVVNRDIDSNVIVAGNPCRVIRGITEKDKETYLIRPKTKKCN